METCWIYFASRYDFLNTTRTKKDIFNHYFECTKNEAEAKQYANDCMKIKIGETKHRGQRNNALWQDERIQMWDTIKFKGTKSDRLFVEAYVRSRIENRYSSFNINHIGNDHFVCTNSNIIRTIQREFPTYVEEGLNLLNQIKEKK